MRQDPHAAAGAMVDVPVGPATTIDERIAAHPVANLAIAHYWAKDRAEHARNGMSAIGVPYASEVVDQCQREARLIKASLAEALDAEEQRMTYLLDEQNMMRRLVMDVIVYGKGLLDNETIDKDTAVERILARLNVLEG